MDETYRLLQVGIRRPFRLHFRTTPTQLLEFHVRALGATLTQHYLAFEGAPPGRAALRPPDIFRAPRATRSSRSCDQGGRGLG